MLHDASLKQAGLPDFRTRGSSWAGGVVGRYYDPAEIQKQDVLNFLRAR